VLRKWGTRYGFPLPLRDGNGNRVYTNQQLCRLKLICRLLNDGLRPATIVPLDEAASHALSAGTAPRKPPDSSANAADIVQWLKARDPTLLREKLRTEIVIYGIASFVLNIMPLMNDAVGRAWEKGEFSVRDEHIYSEMMQVLLREALASLLKPAGAPRMLLTTLPGEQHVLGLLMLEILMSLEGACCISLGPQSPIDEAVSAATDFQVDIVALSFSASFPEKKIAPLLKEIRKRLPPSIKLWAGGSGILGMGRTPRGTTLIPDLSEAVDRARAWLD
jgi:methanogenic corrinoid protein MtbC1